MEKTYNRAIFLPIEKIRRFFKRYAMRMTRHAIEACTSDRYGIIRLQRDIEITEKNILEATMEGQAVVKMVIRQRYDDLHDLIMVLIPDDREAIVKTAWLCCKDDNHATLKVWEYAKE